MTSIRRYLRGLRATQERIVATREKAPLRLIRLTRGSVWGAAPPDLIDNLPHSAALDAIYIARCPEHGLHGERTHCFDCGQEVEQVAMVPAAERDEWALRYENAKIAAQGLWKRAVLAEHDLAQAEAELDAALGRCTCPVGWGHVRDVNCPRHRGAAHTIAGAS